MPDLPSHPDDHPEAGSGPRAERPRWKAVVGIAAGVVLVVVFIVLHLTGVLGPGAH